MTANIEAQSVCVSLTSTRSADQLHAAVGVRRGRYRICGALATRRPLTPA